MRRTVLACLTVAIASPAFAQTRTVIVESVPAQDASVLSAPIEYDANGVAKAQYFKADDLSPEQLQALLDEADRVRTYQQVTGLYMAPATTETGPSISSPAATTTYSSTPYASQPVEIELYETPAPSQIVSAPAMMGSHAVIKGDTLYNIAKRYNVSVTDLQQANGIQGSSINLGQIIKIPAATVQPSASFTTAPAVTYAQTQTTSGYVTRRIVEPVPVASDVRSVTSDTDTIYAVLPKDTLYAISRRTCTQVAALISANGISNPNDLKPGQALTIPAGHCLTN